MLAILPSLLFSTRCGDYVGRASIEMEMEIFVISDFTYNQEQCQASFTISISSPIEESLAIEILDADDNINDQYFTLSDNRIDFENTEQTKTITLSLNEKTKEEVTQAFNDNLLEGFDIHIYVENNISISSKKENFITNDFINSILGGESACESESLPTLSIEDLNVNEIAYTPRKYHLLSTYT